MAYCKRCKQHVRTVAAYKVNHVAHLLGTIFLCGLWFPVWIIACLLAGIQGQQCSICGKRI